MTDVDEEQEQTVSWNYRLVRTEHEEIVLAEVYYDGDGKPNGYTAGGCRFGGESVADVREALGLAANALERPVLDDKDFTRT